MEGRFIIDGHVHCGPRTFQGSGAFNIQAGGTDKEVGNPFERLKKNLEDIGVSGAVLLPFPEDIYRKPYATPESS